MRAVAVNQTRNTISVIDHPEPEITSDTQVKLRMLDVGICGTDREIASFQFGTPPQGEEYLIIGHESLGEIVEVGKAVHGFGVGDLVVPRVRRPCPHEDCAPCRANEPDFCYTGDYLERGIKGLHGYLAEFAVVESAYLHGVPQQMRDVAVLTEPLTIAEKALHQVRYIQQRLPGYARHGDEDVPQVHHAVVIGAGPVGILGAMALVASGYRTYVYSREPKDDDRAALVRAIGAAYVSSGEVSPARLPEAAGRIDLVYEAAGAAGIAYEVLQVLGANGIYVFTGVPDRKAPVELNTGTLMRNQVLKNQVVMGTVNAGRADFEAAIAHIAEFRTRWPDALGHLIAARHPADDAERLLTTHLPGIKHVIAMGEVS